MITIAKSEPVKKITLSEVALNLDTQIAMYGELVDSINYHIDKVAQRPKTDPLSRERLEITSYADALQNKVFDLVDLNNELSAVINRLDELIGQ